MTKQEFQTILIVNTIMGADNTAKYLAPNLDGDKATGPAAQVWGEMKTILSEQANIDILLSDPAVSPEAGSPLDIALGGLTERALAKAVELGFVTTIKDTSTIEGWNAMIGELSTWLQEVETPEVEAEPLTAEEAATVVAEVVKDEESVEAARELVTETLGVVVANQMSDAAVIKTALGLGLQKAQETAVVLTESGIADIKEAAISFVDTITKALDKLGASAEIQRGVINSIHAALPEQVQEEVTTA